MPTSNKIESAEILVRAIGPARPWTLVVFWTPDC